MAGGPTMILRLHMITVRRGNHRREHQAKKDGDQVSGPARGLGAPQPTLRPTADKISSREIRGGLPTHNQGHRGGLPTKNQAAGFGAMLAIGMITAKGAPGGAERGLRRRQQAHRFRPRDTKARDSGLPVDDDSECLHFIPGTGFISDEHLKRRANLMFFFPYVCRYPMQTKNLVLLISPLPSFFFRISTFPITQIPFRLPTSESQLKFDV